MIGTSEGQVHDNEFDYTLASNKTFQPSKTAMVPVTEVPQDRINDAFSAVSEAVSTGTFDPQGMNNVDQATLQGKTPTNPNPKTPSSTSSTMPLQPPQEVTGALKAKGVSQSTPETERYQTWPERMARDLVHTAALPGDVYAGKVDPMSDEGIGRAAELAGALIFGPAPVAAKVVDGTLGSIAGITSKTANKEALIMAQEAEKSMVHPNTIWESTGWYRGHEGRWKYEIPDSEAKLKDIKGMTERPLGLVLDHPELFKAYPDLAKFPIRVQPNLGNGGYASPNHIALGEQALSNPSVLLHEIQHVIQEKEGFAKGGDYAKNFDSIHEPLINEVRKKYFDIKNRIGKSQVVTKVEADYLKYARKVFELDAKISSAAKDAANLNYRRLAGETESRNVQTRFERATVYEKYDKASEEFKSRGYSLDIEYTPSTRGWDHVGGNKPEGNYKIRKWKTDEYVDPKDLPASLRKIYNNLTVGQSINKILPSKTEDFPKERQVISARPKRATPTGYE